MLFVDLKIAFDSMDRDILWRELRRRGIQEMLVERPERIYEQTEVVIRTSQGYTESFKMKKNVWQECMMSPHLFNLYMADKEEIKKQRDKRSKNK